MIKFNKNVGVYFLFFIMKKYIIMLYEHFYLEGIVWKNKIFIFITISIFIVGIIFTFKSIAIYNKPNFTGIVKVFYDGAY